MEKLNVVSASSGSLSSTGDGREIGAILVDIGRITPEQLGRILRLQREQGLRFGDAALQLRLLTRADIEFALSRQFNYPYLVYGKSGVSNTLIAAYASSGEPLESLRALRSEIMLRWLNSPDRKTIAIISGERREGRSYITANLAVMFALLGERTLLIDADMRNPCQHALFGLNNRAGLSAVLSGRGGTDLIKPVPDIFNLSVLPSGVLPPNSLELLSQSRFPQLLMEAQARFDVILLDSPAASESGDAKTVAVRAGAALIVARKNVAKIWRLRGVSDTVMQASATVIGTVLNDF